MVSSFLIFSLFHISLFTFKSYSPVIIILPDFYIIPCKILFQIYNYAGENV